MTISVLQERQSSNGSGAAASIQLAFSGAVTPGSSIHVICSSIDTATSFTCSDSVNGSYGAALDTIDQTGDTQRLAHFKFDNTAAGTPTVTITPNTSIGFLAIWIREIGGTSGYDSAHKTALQTALGNGTDNITTGTQAPNNQPGLLSALGVCTSNFVLPSAGTGFTAGANGWTFGTSNTACTESKRYTATTAIAATFSNAGGSNNFASLAAFFKESTGATTITPGAGAIGVTGGTPKMTLQPAAGAGAVALVGGQPTIKISYVVTPGAGAIGVTGGQLGSAYVQPSAGQLALGGAPPVLAFGYRIAPAGGSLSLGATGPYFSSLYFGAHYFSATYFAQGGAPPSPKVSITFNRNPSAATAVGITGGQPIVSVGIVITPGGGTLNLAAGVPGISLSASLSVTPGAGALAFTGQQALITQQINIGTSAGAIALTGGTATRSVGFPRSPTVAAVALSGGTPLVTQQLNVQPSAASAALSGGQPGVTQQWKTQPSAATSLAFVGGQPIVTVANPGLVNTSSAAIALQGGQPIVIRGTVVTPSAGALGVGGGVAALTQQLNPAVTAGAVTITGGQPAVTEQRTAKPSGGSIGLQGGTAQAFQTGRAAPQEGGVALQGGQPIVTTQVTVRPSAGALGLSGAVPGVVVVIPAKPQAGDLAFVGGVPIITQTDYMQSGAVALTGGQPIVRVGTVIRPGAGAIGVASSSSTTSQNFNLQPAAGTLSLVGAAPSIGNPNTIVTPGAGAIGLQGGQASIALPGVFFAVKYFAAHYFGAHYFGGGNTPGLTGQVNATLQGVTVQISGTFVPAGSVSGSIVGKLDDIAGRFVGTSIQVEFFDLPIQITPNWHSTEYPAAFGSIAATLDDVSLLMGGTHVSPNGVTGLVVATLGNVTVDIEGTHVSPANRSSNIVAVLDPVTADLECAFSPTGTRFAVISSRLQNVTAALLGSNVVSPRSGSMNSVLGDVTVRLQGVNVPAGTRIGAIQSTLDGISVTMTGSSSFNHAPTPRRITVPTGRRVIKVRKAR
jgi:hypothetical protein